MNSELMIEKIPLDIREVELDLLEPLRSDERFDTIVEFIDWISTWGYIAGGFPAWLARLKFVPEFKFCHSGDCAKDIDVVRFRKILLNQFLHDHHHSNVVHSDIDVFFESCNDLSAALTMLRKKFNFPKQIKNSRMGAAFEVTVPLSSSLKNAEIRVQLIKNHMGPSKKMIEDFDLLNAMVGYRRIWPEDKYRTWIHRSWKDLEENRTIHAFKWDSPMVIKRINKYIVNKGYKSLTQETSEALVAASGLLINDLKSGKLDSNVFPPVRKLGLYLLNMTNHFSIEQLLSLSMIKIDLEDYDPDAIGNKGNFHQRVMKEVIRRGLVETETI